MSLKLNVFKNKRGCKVKNITSIFLAFLLSSCSFAMSKNTTTTETFYDPLGEVSRVVVTEELTDDATYYKQAAKVQIEKQVLSCHPNCAPGEMGMIAAMDLIGKITGNSFVERGMNGVEAGESLGRAIIQQAPLGILAVGLGQAAKRPSSVNINGKNNTYNPNEYHWTGNTGSESSYQGPISGEIE